MRPRVATKVVENPDFVRTAQLDHIENIEMNRKGCGCKRPNT
jgi:hypothetical protein